VLARFVLLSVDANSLSVMESLFHRTVDTVSLPSTLQVDFVRWQRAMIKVS